ncbi:hypothetical protein DFH09DRAFT_1301444 [Mycena vulgaris]|nr:hypothetical protein DFH09DRAFT_1301444 [Mycena vulgaris]
MQTISTLTYYIRRGEASFQDESESPATLGGTVCTVLRRLGAIRAALPTNPMPLRLSEALDEICTHPPAPSVPPKRPSRDAFPGLYRSHHISNPQDMIRGSSLHLARTIPHARAPSCCASIPSNFNSSRIIDGPTTGVTRQSYPYKHLTLAPLTLTKLTIREPSPQRYRPFPATASKWRICHYTTFSAAPC